MKEQKTNKGSILLTSEYVFDYRKGSLIGKNGKEIFLETRLKDFFIILMENKNDVVTRDELMAHVWKDVFVNEESITKAASDFRKLLVRNNIDGFKLITLRKLGYKLEITEPVISQNRKTNLFISMLRIFGYACLVFGFLIILIRAMKY